MNLNYLKDKEILILGFAREGRDSFLFLRKLFPQKILGIADKSNLKDLDPESRRLIKKDKYLNFYSGQNYLKSFKKYNLIIKSPGIPLKRIKPFIGKKQILTSQTEIFFASCPGKIIGITGTKGKSTTASLIYQVLKSGGLKAFLVGNIGQPVLFLLLNAISEDIYVYELSSHQLADLKKSPQIAVFLNLYPEHLDYYRSFNEYFKAKQNICRYQKKTDFFLFNPENKYVFKTAKISRARKIALSSKTAEKFLAKCGKTKLIGDFNLLNMAAAIEVGKIFKVSKSKIIKTLKGFKPLPHRLEFIGQYQEIKFYNDSLATIPQATIEALAALGNEVETIFLGGFDRNLEFKKLAKKIIASNLKTLIFFPGTGKKIWREIRKIKPQNRFFNYFFIDKMERGVDLAFKYTHSGKICLLSCASPSFDLFSDYKDRGDQFKKYVRQFRK